MGEVASMAGTKAPGASPTTKVMEKIMATQYTLRVKNESTLSGFVCVYQTFEEQETLDNVFSLAWFCKGCNPHTQVRFTWNIDYAFSWSESGVLVPGVTFDASELKPADPNKLDHNAVNLTHGKYGYQFIDPIKQAPRGTLGIFADATVPVGKAAVGIAMGGSPAIAVQAGPNLSYTFKPHPIYWACFGTYEEGAVIDVNRITGAQQIIFAPNEYSKYLTLQGDNTWKVENALQRNLAIASNFSK